MFHSQINSIYKKGKNGAAVLLIHGFTGTPDLMRPLANHLHEKGFTVMAPLLAGHGSTREHLAASNWKDWYETVTNALQELQKESDQIFVSGLSLGGILTLRLAEEYSETIRAIACLATPLVLERWVHMALPAVMNSPLKFFYRYQKKAGVDVKDESAKKNIWTVMEMPIAAIHSLTKLQKIVSKNLTKVTSPTLIVHARADSTAPYENMALIAKGISSPVTETITLENSFHLVTVDYEKDLVNQKVSEFFTRFMRTPA
jgi:carboxylesterase